MAELTDREIRQITFCANLAQAEAMKSTYYIDASEITQILEDIRAIAKERNHLEDEVLALSARIYDQR